jgi:hypothetical protein
MADGIAIRVWDDRDETWARRFRTPLPDGSEHPGGRRLRELREQAGDDGVLVLPRPVGDDSMRIPLRHWADDDPEHTFRGIGVRSSSPTPGKPPPNARRPPPPPADLRALLDELTPLQQRFRAGLEQGDEAELERLEPLIDAQWQRIEAHPAHRGFRMRAADEVEIEPGIRVFDTRRGVC